jgi:tol-pal system protein YbgF
MQSLVARAVRSLTPVALLATGACFATQSDVRVLQNDLQIMRTESAMADSVRRAQLDTIIASLGRNRDSLESMGARLGKFQGDVREELYSLGQQLIQVQELTGQSQRRLQELRASLDQRAQELAAPPAVGAQDTVVVPAVSTSPGGTAAGAAPTTPTTPGPNQLFQLALDQLRRGSTGAARTGFQDLLRQYPTADIAPDAQFYLAETIAAEGNAAAADSAYAEVVAKYPQSQRAPTAAYKRAVAHQRAGRIDQARTAFTQLVERYPRSEEAALAREQLRTLR